MANRTVKHGDDAGDTASKKKTARLIAGAVAVAVIGGLGSWPTYGPQLYHYFFPGKPLSVVVDRTRPSKASTVTGVKSAEDHSWGKEAWVLPTDITLTSPEVQKHLTSTADQSAYRDDFGDWIAAEGGADLGSTHLRLTLHAGRSPIVIEGICAQVAKREAPLRGALFGVESQGTEPTLKTDLNLDSVTPCDPNYQNKVVTIASGDAQVIDLTATTISAAVTWHLAVDLVSEDKKTTFVVDPDAPYRTSPPLSNSLDYAQYLMYDFGSEGGPPGFVPSVPSPDDHSFTKKS